MPDRGTSRLIDFSLRWSELHVCCHEMIFLVTIFISKMGVNDKCSLACINDWSPRVVSRKITLAVNQKYVNWIGVIARWVKTISTLQQNCCNFELFCCLSASQLPSPWHYFFHIYSTLHKKFHEICSILYPYLGWGWDRNMKWVGGSISSGSWCLVDYS